MLVGGGGLDKQVVGAGTSKGGDKEGEVVVGVEGGGGGGGRGRGIVWGEG